jgi:hypothetical protein
MICFTRNSPIKSHTNAYRLGKNYNLPQYTKHPFYHAESHLVSKLLDKYNTIDPNWSIVVLRINRQGIILGSKPCENCNKLLSAVGLDIIYYSNDNGTFCLNGEIVC